MRRRELGDSPQAAATHVMSAEMTIPAAIHRAKGTLNEPSSITGGSIPQSEKGQTWSFTEKVIQRVPMFSEQVSSALNGSPLIVRERTYFGV